MPGTAPTLFARSDLPQPVTAPDHLAVVADDRQEAAMIQLEAEVSAAARRLRDASRHRAEPVVTPAADGVVPDRERTPIDGARARILLNVAPEPTSHHDARQEASDADRMQRHQQLAARGASLLAAIEAARPNPVAVDAGLAPNSMFSR